MCSVNELDPIVNVTNDPNPFRLNVDNGLKHSSPIVIDISFPRFDKRKLLEFPNDVFPIDNEDNFGKSILSFNLMLINYFPYQMVLNRNYMMSHQYYRFVKFVIQVDYLV